MLAIHTNENKSDEVQSESFSEHSQNSRLLSIQPKLSVGAVDDSFEHEADAMADRVMRMPESPFVQRKCASCEHEEEEQIQRKITPFIQKQGNASEGGMASEDVTNQINASRGGGSRMSENTLSFMESRFNADFSNVKIHTDANAVQMSRELNAQAFTVGSDIYFNSGKYSPESTAGKHLLAHELTHTVQQVGGVERKVQREPVTAITISGLAIKCILGAIAGVLFDLGLQFGTHFFRSRDTAFVVDYCSLIISAVLSCIAAPIISYGIEAWITARMATTTYASIVGSLLGRILIWIVARAGMAVPKWLVGRLFRLGCISPQQHAVLQDS